MQLLITNYYLPKEDLFYSKNKTIDDKKIIHDIIYIYIEVSKI